MKLKALALAAALGTALPAMADMPYPFIAPDCHHTLRLPANQAGVYFSEDCTTAFIMPDKYGKLTIDSVSDLPNLDLCTGLSQASATVNTLQNQITDISNQLAKLPLDSVLRDKAIADITKLTELQTKLLSTYDNIIGGYAQVTFATSLFDQRKNDFLVMNQDLIINNKINLLEMPISESYLSFSAKPLADGVRMKAVLAHSIPGVAQPNENGEAAVDHVRMNGSLSGQLALSLYGLCGKRRPNWKPEDLAADLVTNMTYTVPVLSLAGYTAALNVDSAVKTFLNSIQTKSQFSVSEMTDMIATGSAGAAYSYQLKNYEMPNVYTADDQKTFFDGLRTSVFQRLTDRLLEQLKIAGFLSLESPPKTAEAPAPGFIDEVHTGTNCSSNWFTSSCSDYRYVVKIPASSSADTIIKKLADLHFTDTEETYVRQPISRVYTAAFVTDPDKAIKK